MNDNKVVKAGIGYIIGNYLIKGLSFITVPLFVRLLSTAEYGQYNTYMAYESIFSIFIGLALYSSFKNAYYNTTINYKSYVSQCLLLAFLNYIFVSIILNIIYFFFHLDYGTVLLNLLLIHSLSSSILSYYNVHISINFEYKKFIYIALFNALANVFMSLILIFTFYKNDRLMGRILGTVIPLLIITIFVYITFWKKAAPKFNTKYFRYALKYSLPIIPHGLSQVILSQFDRIMITSLAGNSSAGIYSFAYNIYSIVAITYTSLNNTWSPWFYSNLKEKNIADINRVSTAYAYGMLLFSVMVILAAPEIISILGTSEYVDSVYSVIPLVIAGYFSFLYSIPVEVEYFYEKTKYIALGTLAAAVINIVLNLFFINKFGYIAASYTTAFTYLLYFLFHYFLANKIDNRDMFSISRLMRYVIIIIFFGCLSTVLLPFRGMRWGIMSLVGILLLYHLNKHMALFQKLKIIIRKGKE